MWTYFLSVYFMQNKDENNNLDDDKSATENKKILDNYYKENESSIKEKLTKYTYTFKKENDNYVLVKYAIN